MANPDFTPEELASETWGVVVSFDRYEVSNLGRVRRCVAGHHTRVGKILKAFPDKGGYLRVNLRNGDGHPYMRFVHRLVALAFLPERPNCPHVNHKDGFKTNNRLINLEHVTAQENMRHAAVFGLTMSHENHHRARLSKHDVREIRASTDSVKTLMNRYEMSETQIRRLRAGEQWRGV